MESEGFQRRMEERALLAGVSLTPTLAAQLEAYYHLLTRWNEKINLTALRLEPATNQAIDRLFIEPLSASQFLLHEMTWFDLGSGGGSPAIPLKLASPLVRLIMVESKERKAAFLKEAVRVLKLERTTVEIARIEAITAKHPLAGSVNVVSVRAVRIDPILFTAIRTLLHPRGKTILFGAKSADLSIPPDFQVVHNSTPGRLDPVVLSWNARRNSGASL
jgi:16S rRNA (guanine527-N7)-methyltransferase